MNNGLVIPDEKKRCIVEIQWEVFARLSVIHIFKYYNSSMKYIGVCSHEVTHGTDIFQIRFGVVLGFVMDVLFFFTFRMAISIGVLGTVDLCLQIFSMHLNFYSEIALYSHAFYSYVCLTCNFILKGIYEPSTFISAWTFNAVNLMMSKN